MDREDRTSDRMLDGASLGAVDVTHRHSYGNVFIVIQWMMLFQEQASLSSS